MNVAIRDKAVLGALNAFDVTAYLRSTGWHEAPPMNGGTPVWQQQTPAGPAEVWVPLSHEFADSSRWNCYRLTALDGDETLFGYAMADSEVAKSIVNLLNQNQGRKTSLILRLSVPEGVLSRSGVVIEKLLSPRWIYLDPPEA